jgi:hypothetical protein
MQKSIQTTHAEEPANNPEGGATFAYTLPAHQGDPDL